MKFVCLNERCKRTFIYPAKKLEHVAKTEDAVRQANMTGGLILDKDEIEYHVCPYCLSLDFEETVEPQPEITSVVSVPIEDVDAKLKEGYVVKELYARSATLVKLDKKEA